MPGPVECTNAQALVSTLFAPEPKKACRRAGSEADAQAGLAGGFLDLDDLPAVETNEPALFFATNHAVDFFGGEQLAVLAVAEAARRPG